MAGNRDVLASPGSYFFLSNSAGQGDEWLKTLNKGVWIPFTGVFGQRLEETVLYERRYGVRLVPLVVEQCVTFIRERGMQEVGLFRQSGQSSLVKELQEAFDAGERPSFDSSTDVHTVASLLKLYLRQLPEPLVPYGRYQEFLLCGQKLKSDRAQGLGELRTLLHELPVANFNLLNFICQFLNEVQTQSSSNKMSGQNLATVFGPNILRAKAEDPQSIMGAAALVQLLMLQMIREHESLFSKVPPSLSARPSPGSRASPSSLQQPHLQPPPCLRQLSLPLIAERCREPGPAAAEALNPSCAYSAVTKSDLSSGQKRLLGHRYTSSHPENCFYAQPSSGLQPVQAKIDYHLHHAEQKPQQAASSLQVQNPASDSSKPRPLLVAWSQAWMGPADTGAGFWSSGTVEDGCAVPETTSGGSSEAQEDSILSAYDNLVSVSLCARVEEAGGDGTESDDPGGQTRSSEEEEEGEEEEEEEEEEKEEEKLEEAGQTRDSSSSWSSCEVLPLDDGEDDDEGDDDGEIASSSQVGKSPNDEHEDDSDDEGGRHIQQLANSPASCSVLSDSPLSTGSSEVFLPSGPSELQELQESQVQSRDTYSLLAELRQQMVQQKAEYQAKIHRLERCNDILKHQVAVLRVSLEQQRRSQSVAEIKIRNVERAKADADLRNSTLQREMELFFQMYGAFRQRGADGGAGGTL
ncbi:uncharacterized protein V6R79_016948 [Siganus canaliculatus]